jgi:3-deoxy-D-manno-octulosonic-acid transferase
MRAELNWRERSALAIYSALVWLMQPWLLRRLARRARSEPAYATSVEERLGRYSDAPSAGWLWLHAVSLGETRAAALLLAQLRQQQPGLRLLLTHGTATGWTAGRELLEQGDRQAWLPWDSRGAVDRFLAHFRPRAGLLLETEIWPNLVQSCLRCGVPLVLVNARLNPKSFGSARRLRWLAQPAYRGLRCVFAQSEADAVNLRALGARVGGVFGNIKFDAEPDLQQLAKGRAWRSAMPKPVLMLASSRDGEEASLLAAVVALAQAPGTPGWPASLPFQLLLVPRHPQRVDAVAALFEQAGFTVSRRSQWTSQTQPADLWLGDTMGELALYYAMSQIALLGGSFEALGGQNLIEAAACACPVLMGPHTFNFSEAAQLALDAGAARRADDMAAALGQALRWMAQTEALAQARLACVQFAGAHRGASQRTAAAVLSTLAQHRAGAI